MPMPTLAAADWTEAAHRLAPIAPRTAQLEMPCGSKGAAESAGWIDASLALLPWEFCSTEQGEAALPVGAARAQNPAEPPLGNFTGLLEGLLETSAAPPMPESDERFGASEECGVQTTLLAEAPAPAPLRLPMPDWVLAASTCSTPKVTQDAASPAPAAPQTDDLEPSDRSARLAVVDQVRIQAARELCEHAAVEPLPDPAPPAWQSASGAAERAALAIAGTLKFKPDAVSQEPVRAEAAHPAEAGRPQAAQGVASEAVSRPLASGPSEPPVRTRAVADQDPAVGKLEPPPASARPQATAEPQIHPRMAPKAEGPQAGGSPRREARSERVGSAESHHSGIAEAMREAAFAGQEPARIAKPHADSRPAEPEPVQPQDPPASETRDIALTVAVRPSGRATSQPIAVRLTEQGGEIRLTVRSADPQLVESLRGGLPELVARLERSGFELHNWTPAEVAIERGGSSDGWGAAPGDSGGGFDGGGGGPWRQGAEGERREPPQPPQEFQQVWRRVATTPPERREFHGFLR